jgi:hypothetical protein
MDKWVQAEMRRPLECRGQPENNPQIRAATNPWTGMVCCVCLYSPELKAGWALYLGKPSQAPKTDGFTCVAYGTEADLIRAFWGILNRHPNARVVGFNSRRFDSQFMFVRSYVHDIECTMNLAPYRFSTKEHLDLYDALGSWGVGQVPSLDVVSQIAGIDSSKGEMTGAKVQEFYDAGRMDDIVRYCIRDVRCEAEHMARWERTVGRVFGSKRKW